MSHRLLLPILLVSIVSACNSRTDRGGPTNVPITTELGGVVRSATHDVEIPAFALPADTQVILSTADVSGFPPLSGAHADVFRIEPEGTELSVSARVSIHSSLIGAEPADEVRVLQLVESDGAGWIPLEAARDATTGDVIVSISRFAPLAVVVEQTVVVDPPLGAARIEGVMNWGEGSPNPVANAPIELLFQDSVLTTAETNPDGSFAFGDLEPGLYGLSVSFECDLYEEVRLEPGQVARVELALCSF